ncbi:MAG: quinone-dependent dihydroorotate dehydrogenase [Myxococcota bacterium]
MYRTLLQPLLFRLDAETAHHLGLWGLSLAEAAPGVAKLLRRRAKPERSSLKTRVAGLDFPNPVGLAAGLDKNAEAIVGLFALGFGSVEVGTVTPRAQPGNDKPRIFRLKEHEAIINRMGFNNEGMHAMAGRLRELEWRPAPIGVNLGKNKDTPLEAAVDDYVKGAALLSPLADYVVVNLSSPNTPGLRQLQEPEALAQLLRGVRAEVKGRPLFLKIAPDLGDEAVDAVVDVARDCGTDGLICTNTTITRPVEHPLAKETGGLSGRPLLARSTEVLRRAFKRADGKLPLVGVGGISSGEDAWQKICAGASLVQVYSGFIYRGPALVTEILDALETKLSELKLGSLAEAVGRDA